MSVEVQLPGQPVNAGIYARLSVKHQNKKDESIQNQILLGRRWLEQQREAGIELVEYHCYTDIGYSGTGFDRPAFQRMLEDAQKKRLQCIICKDSSRLGRDYLEVGHYMEQVFPRLGIRLVCISDGYDSARELSNGSQGDLTIHLKNLMNEWYARDISRRVRLVKAEKKRQGEYPGSCPPYGYRITKQNGKRILEEDSQTMEICQNILAWYRQGIGVQKIRERLEEKHISPPGWYRKTGKLYGDTKQSWSRSTICRILHLMEQ